MYQYRAVASKSLQEVDDGATYQIDTSQIKSDIRLRDLWAEISASSPSGTTLKQCEDLLLVEAVLRATKQSGTLQREDLEAARFLIFWTANVVLPTEDFTSSWENAQLVDDTKPSQPETYKLSRLRSSVGVSVLALLDSISPISNLESDDGIDVITSIAAFTCRLDPWTTEQAFDDASTILQNYESFLRSNRREEELTAVLENILRKKVKPLFSKTKTPAVTAAGRKNVHPIPQPRFDPSIFDPESKPWKFRYVYIITVLSWVIERYSPSDKFSLESQFPLLVPAILSLIDDENLSFKAKGCELLLKFLSPLEQSNSDVLQRTNLDSVFQEALYPCLLSIPTITPEAESIHLLQYAYPALFAVIRTRFSSPKVPSAPTLLRPYQTKMKHDPDSQKRLESLTRLLRHGILHSYHHTSNPRPIENTSISSYPYPRLSALLLSQLPPALSELGIHTTKHLQDLVPTISAALSNPFGTAFPPLLAAAAEAARALVLNAWPRVWRWRAELLGGLYIGISASGDGDSGGGGGQTVVLLQLQCALKVVVAVLRIAIEENVVAAAEEGGNGTGGRDGDQGGREEETIDVDREFGKLVQGDDRLRELLIGNECFDAQ
ncbi:predicted protein [Histoplasma mississippiense (nom. inval.)]|uniref:predicted protein n=1 Tax=Ajellomyces capsulatus (strain NAm1 / WU24) TaxID=2059318 RepID=UPI000157CAEB|nr:predicted protein [Histoplasma mississippiense (nom. inval.)]EDN09340.1 predicted protein [Histoplasma mississippiense (nom. inval.)]